MNLQFVQVSNGQLDLGQVWYLIVSIPDLCTLTYFVRYKESAESSDSVEVWNGIEVLLV